MEKTKVKIIEVTHQCMLNIGDVGYIDGYCRAGDDRPYAIVVSGKVVDMVPLHTLEVIGE